MTRPFETAALIFRAAVSLRLHKPMTTCRDTVADWRLIYRVLLPDAVPGTLTILGNFTFEEMNLMCIYNTGSRTGLIDSLREMRGELAPEETELRELTDSALGKLQAMSDAEFAELELYPDFEQ